MPFSLYGDLPQPKSEKDDTKNQTVKTSGPATLSSLYASLPKPASEPSQTAEVSAASVSPTSAWKSPIAPNTSPAAVSIPPKPAGWSAYGHFRPVMRKPTLQAKPKLMKPVIPAGATVVSTTTVGKEQLSTTEAPSSTIKAATPVPAAGPNIGTIPYLTSSDDVNGFRTVQQSKKKGKYKGKQNTNQPPVLVLSEDYDPHRPNDYEEYKEERKRLRDEKRRRQQQEKSRQRRYSDDSRSRSRSPSPYSDYSSRSQSRSRSRSRSPKKHGNVFAPPANLYESSSSPPRAVSPAPHPEPHHTPPSPEPRSKIDLNESAEDAYMRRARLSQRTVEQRTEQEGPKAGLGSGQEMARKMLAKYGWQEGQGLGRSENGIREALQVQATGRGSGVIINTHRAEAPPAPPAPSDLDLEPSQVIILTNMVGPGEVDDMLQEETADECAKYGKVERCLIFEVPNGQISDDQAVRIFVKFAVADSAQQAITDLHGRYFGGRIVSARFFDCNRFDRLDLAPRPEEFAQFRKQ